MIPLRDTVESRNYPIVNTIVIGLNVLVYLGELTQGHGLTKFIYTYGLVPARYSVPEAAHYFSPAQQVLALFTFMFIHGGFLHLLGNMWSLFIFGDNVEDRLGPIRYLLFYLLCDWASGMVHLFMNWDSNIPTIGASGAIAGVMGAYLISFPSSRILTFIPIFFLPYFIEIPAFFFLGIWFLFQFFHAAGSTAQSGGIAWWAHIGGFVSGIVILKLLLKIPQLGVTSRLRHATSKRKTPRLQVLRTDRSADDAHLYGDISITPKEAQFGTRKLVNIPWGYQRRLFWVRIPPGVNHGTTLRLTGVGKRIDKGQRGNLYLKVSIRP
jgi:membrane associated rhomboid family serine protease